MICPFCGQDEKATREHVFGQQFARRFPSVAKHIEGVGDFAEPWAHDTVVKTDDGYVTRQVPRGVQEPELHQVVVKLGAVCNNGWMADLDNEAVEILEAVTADGGFRPPTAAEGATLARWLVKIGMAYDLYQAPAERAYTESLRREFYETRTLSPGTSVYAGYEPDQREWLPFWQYGWRVAPPGTSAAEVLSGPPRLSTSFFGLNGLRLVAHRVSREIATETRQLVRDWQEFCMTESRMVQIAPQLTAARFEPMDTRTVTIGMYTLRQFVDTHLVQVAPSSPEASPATRVDRGE